jgi:CBS domain-containing protein
MSKEIYQYLSGVDPFSDLPKGELGKIIDKTSEVSYPAGTTLAVQARTRIENVLVIRSGVLKLYYDRNGEEIQVRRQKRGQIFGGISTLMNGGFSVRTVEAEQDVTAYAVPAEMFQNLCDRYKRFYEFFVNEFSDQMDDESYADIIVSNQALRFLRDVPPFSFLDQEVLEEVAEKTIRAHYPADTVLFVQGRSRVDYLHVIEKGAAERYYEEKDKKTLRGVMSEGDLYGGISMLVNNNIAVRTLKTHETTYFYLVPRQVFLDLCRQHEAFSEYFSDTFGKRMLDRSYAEIVAKTLEPQEAALQFFNRPVSSCYNPHILSCNSDLSIQDAARMMSDQKCSSILIRDTEGSYVGILTDNDLRTKVIATGYDIRKPVRDIMASPLKTIPTGAQIFETFMMMMRDHIKHLAVTDTDNRVVGVVSNRDLLTAQGRAPFFFIREIGDTEGVDALQEKYRQLPEVVQHLIQSGAKSDNINSFVTSISDTILEKLVADGIREVGDPPCRFVFMIMGSEGRKEQTLKTDQDNAILYEDVPEEAAEETRDYFMKLGETVCNWLDQVGYDFCEGGVMAKNPKWCQPLAAWKQHFSSWIHAAEAEDLLQASIFFDFRTGYGDAALVDQLRRFLFKSLGGWSGFFRHLTENALHFKPPLGFFRSFVVESKGEHRNKFDIKSAMTPLVDFARIYALKHKIAETNTLERLHQLYLKNFLSWDEYNELDQAYGFLMQIRFLRQVTAVLEEGGEPDNYVNPKKLSGIEQTMLKEIFKRTEKYQGKLNFDFIGII